MTVEIGDPSINPWLSQVWIVGTDERGQEKRELLPHPVPPLYFWLGADAYPEWRMVSSISPPASPEFIYRHTYIEAGFEFVKDAIGWHGRWFQR